MSDLKVFNEFDEFLREGMKSKFCHTVNFHSTYVRMLEVLMEKLW